MNQPHAIFLSDDELIRLPSLSVEPDDPEAFFWRGPGRVVWVVGPHLGGRIVVRGPAQRPRRTDGRGR